MLSVKRRFTTGHGHRAPAAALDHGRSGATCGPVSRIRTSLILTEAQFQRIRDIADEDDASIGWVLRQAIDRYLEGVDRRIGGARAVRQPRTERPHLDVIRPVVVAGDNNRRTRREVEERGRRSSQPRSLLQAHSQALGLLAGLAFLLLVLLVLIELALAIVVERLLCRYALVPRCVVRGRLKPAELVGLALGFAPALLVRLRRGGLLLGLFMYVVGLAAVFPGRDVVSGLRALDNRRTPSVLLCARPPMRGRQPTEAGGTRGPCFGLPRALPSGVGVGEGRCWVSVTVFSRMVALSRRIVSRRSESAQFRRVSPIRM